MKHPEFLAQFTAALADGLTQTDYRAKVEADLHLPQLRQAARIAALRCEIAELEFKRRCEVAGEDYWDTTLTNRIAELAALENEPQ